MLWGLFTLIYRTVRPAKICHTHLQSVFWRERSGRGFGRCAKNQTENSLHFRVYSWLGDNLKYPNGAPFST